MLFRKNLVSSFLSILILFAISTSIKANENKISENDKTVISVPTIQCESCASRIEKALKQIDGVIECKVDLDGKTAAVTYDNSVTSVSALETAITKLGYDANDKAKDEDAYGKLPKCCQGK